MATPLLDEASDPTTAPARLTTLADSNESEVADAARSNPNLDEARLVFWLRLGDLAAWSNPQTPFVLLTSTDAALVEGAKQASLKYLAVPAPVFAPVLRETITPLVRQWWGTETKVWRRIRFAGVVAESAGYDRPLHRQAVRLGMRLTEATLERVATGRDAREGLALVRSWLDDPTPPLVSQLERARTRAQHAVARARAGVVPTEAGLAATYELLCFVLSTVNADNLVNSMLNELGRRLVPGERLDAVVLPVVAELYPDAPLAEDLRP